jgi:hypothetical protein
MKHALHYIGGTIFIASMIMLFYIYLNEYRAQTYEWSAYNRLSAPICETTFDLEKLKKFYTVEESVPIKMIIKIVSGKESCDKETSGVLSGTSFIIKPSERQKAIFNEDGTAEILWILEPTKIGNHHLLYGHKNTDVYGEVIVVSLFGLTILQSKILSFITAFLGATITLPWLLEYFRNKKLNK